MAIDRTFAANLQAAIEAKPKLNMRDRRVLGILQGKPSKRRDRQIARMENHARAAIDADPQTKAIDWSKVDWSKVLKTILAILAKILPLLLLL